MSGGADRIEQFERELTTVGGKVCRAGSPKEAREFVRELASSRRMKRAVRESSLLFRELAVDGSLEEAGTQVLVETERSASPEEQEALLGKLAAADLGLTEADYALADTGTLALLSGPGRGRSLSLLPPVHVALLRPGQVLSGMDELFAQLGRDLVFRETSCLTLITGPSRTADIELELTIGVHGPRELHVIVLDFR